MSQNRVSVIVLVHDRTEYLTQALESLARQTISSQEFEVILISAFDPNEQLKSVPNLEVKVKICRDKNIGVKMVEGIKMSSGDIIAFLDDDDRFHPAKLEHVIDVFSRDPSIGLYRNNVAFMDEVGNTVDDPTPSHRKFISKRKLLRISINDVNSLSTVWKADTYFNNSTMSLRKSTLEGLSVDLTHIPIVSDPILLYGTLLLGQVIIADANELTYYRLHQAHFSTSTPLLREYYSYILSWNRIKMIARRTQNHVAVAYAAIVMETLRLSLLSKRRLGSRRQYISIATRVLREDRAGVICYLRAFRLFGLLTFIRILWWSISSLDAFSFIERKY